MRSKEQIEVRLAEAESQLENFKDWVDKATENYLKDRQHWGREADDGELLTAQDAYRDARGEVKLLKWVLAE